MNGTRIKGLPTSNDIERHHIDFAAALEFEWDTAIETIDDRHNYGETRWVTIGFILQKLHVMVYTVRDLKMRIICLRKANKRESNHYEEAQQKHL